jgi:uncharacterized cupredoxin-like copper-binding protein
MSHSRKLLLIPVLLLALTAASPKVENVEVVLDEYTIEMPQTLPPGPTVFAVRNEGRKSHSFKIQGPGLDAMLETVVRPKETGTLEVTLQPGEYQIHCPIGSHAAKGMTMKLAVGAKP